jgi:prepilin-type N-terminal cleavage/methylation domain-containing protein
MNQGFTLLETLVAFVILSLVTITGFTLLGDSFRAVGHVEQRVKLQEEADSLLAQSIHSKVASSTTLQVTETELVRTKDSPQQPVRVRISSGTTVLVDTLIIRQALQ